MTWVAMAIVFGTVAIIAAIILTRRSATNTSTDALRRDGGKVVCCQHNQCPARPKADKSFKDQPWRCPDCRQWWVTELVGDWHGQTWNWKRVSVSAGDGFVEDLT